MQQKTSTQIKVYDGNKNKKWKLKEKQVELISSELGEFITQKHNISELILSNLVTFIKEKWKMSSFTLKYNDDDGLCDIEDYEDLLDVLHEKKNDLSNLKLYVFKVEETSGFKIAMIKIKVKYDKECKRWKPEKSQFNLSGLTQFIKETYKLDYFKLRYKEGVTKEGTNVYIDIDDKHALDDAFKDKQNDLKIYVDKAEQKPQSNLKSVETIKSEVTIKVVYNNRGKFWRPEESGINLSELRRWVIENHKVDWFELKYEEKEDEGYGCIDEDDELRQAFVEYKNDLKIYVDKIDKEDIKANLDHHKPENKQIEEKVMEKEPEVRNREIRIKNPFIINIGISKYDNLTRLQGCEKDFQTVYNLFVDHCKYNKYLNSEYGSKSQDILNIFKAGKDKMKSDQKEDTADALIITFSGCGGFDDKEHYICGSDYDPNKKHNQISIESIQNIFAEDWFNDIPKILIIDAYRGQGNKNIAPQKIGDSELPNWFLMFSNENDGKNGGFLIQSISELFEDDRCFTKIDNDKGVVLPQYRLTLIEKKIRLEAFKSAKKKVSVSRKEILITERTISKDDTIFFQKGTDDIFIKNPVIVNIGVSKYKNCSPLDECGKDIDTMNKLWKNTYGYKHVFDNKGKPDLKEEEFWNIMDSARAKFANKSNKHDSIIISFSGHGDAENIYFNDYDGSNGKVMISEMQKHVSKPNIRDKVLMKCPRIAIIDACRGQQDPNTKDPTEQIRLHPMDNWVALYSNTSGYKSKNKFDGGILITCVEEIL
eukprot:358289_1